MDKPRTFQYIKLQQVGGRYRYFCLQQNLAVLVWLLYFTRDPLQPIILPNSRQLSPRFIVNGVRNKYRRFRKNLTLLIKFSCYKYQWRRTTSVLDLPFYGQLCVPVHKGYKIFDLWKGVVAKVFDQDVNPSIVLSEIDRLKATAQIAFAPSIRGWNIAQRWYEEDYISGALDDRSLPLDSRTVLTRFCHDLVQPMTSLLFSQQPIIKNVEEYINDILKILAISRLSRQEMTASEFHKIKAFLDSIVDRLRLHGNCPVFLVFTHGDFIPANIVNTGHGLKLLDWESAGYRSALYDFYSYFFYRSVCRDTPIDTVFAEINEALPFFISKLPKKEPDISRSLIRLGNVYRWIYYVEQVCQDVEREMTDKNLNILAFILRHIDSYSRYEKILAAEIQVNTETGN